MAIRGASGPRTTPRQSVANEARMMPGSSTAWDRTARLEPLGRLVAGLAGEEPDGEADEQAAEDEGQIDHHDGWLSKPRSPGSVVKTYSWTSVTPLRKP